jgi:DMSO/TMAO reductase YedYZ molybdopterin-dependent catalytic subunit
MTMDELTRIFKLLETADNFIKYAPPTRTERAAERARRRLEKAGELADRAGAAELVEQVRLRLADLDRRAAEVDADDLDEADTAPIGSSSPPTHARDRVPPGQRVTRGWPVLHEGRVPKFDPNTWSFDVDGATARPLRLTYDEMMTLDHAEIRSDFHCVTGWSKLDNVWGGVRARTVIGLAGASPSAAFVSVRAEHGYTANLPLETLLGDDVLLAWRHNGKDLEPKHGWPLRLVVPKLYAWKSVKWVRGITLLQQDRRGFWEVRGYHNRADPWLEERYSFQED